MMDGYVAKIGRATVRFSIDADPTGEHAEFQGGSTMTFDPVDVERFQDIDAGNYSMDGRRHGYPLGDLLRESEPDDDDPVPCSNADACIMMLAAMGLAGGEYDVEYTSDGSAFWLFHDLSHARHDVEVGDDGRQLTISISGDHDERRAHVEGGREALRAGMGLAEVVREIVGNEGEFGERFGVASGALDDLLGSLTVEVRDV